MHYGTILGLLCVEDFMAKKTKNLSDPSCRTLSYPSKLDIKSQ